MNGVNYVPYSPVQAFSAPNDGIIPSSATQVGGYYYDWNDAGFIGSGWYVTKPVCVPEGPTVKFEFESEEAVNEYLTSMPDPNLNQVFEKWNNWLAENDPTFDFSDEFRDAVLKYGGPGCVHH